MTTTPSTVDEAHSAAEPAMEIKTAEDYIRHALVEAARLLDRIHDPKTDKLNHVAIAHYISKFPAIVFLEALRRRDPQEADHLAAWVHQAQEDGDTAGEFNWFWSQQIQNNHAMTRVGGNPVDQPPLPGGLATVNITVSGSGIANTIATPYVPTRTPGLIITQDHGLHDGRWSLRPGRWSVTHEPTLLKVAAPGVPLDVAQSIAARLGQVGGVDWTQPSRELFAALDNTVQQAIHKAFTDHNACWDCSDADHLLVLPFRTEVDRG
ncbi:hypothetical protein BBK82_03685 [Lentzea guizhouensis]|uniref:Uncharacterized protein n=1 Tax=Lentzea guizhouensis TaxID=1586287 RepID=A0A1B2HC71_9PSEU|nr:hypothetical protein [Lentzea guizhouensis]ANZ35318.1 hypothetical protein BBK82_03685 [Lentzea guizhouensis]